MSTRTVCSRCTPISRGFVGDCSHAIKDIFFFPNGNYAACDKKGNQIPEEQGSAWISILQDKLNRGVINDKTRVSMAGWPSEYTVAMLIEEKRLTRPGRPRRR